MVPSSPTFCSKLPSLKRGWSCRRSASMRSVRARKAPVRKPRPSGRIGDEADAELAHGRQDLRLDVAAPQRVFGLQRGEGMGGVGAAYGVRARLAYAEMAHLAGLDQPRHGADRLLDRHVRVDAVEIVEVDHLDSEPLQAGLAGDRDIVRPAIGEAALAIRPAHIAELGGEDRLVAPALQRLADELLVPAGGIGVRRVDEVEPELQRAMDGGDGFWIVRRAVLARHAVAAEPDIRHAQPAGAQ